MTTDIHKRLPPQQDLLISSLVEFERSLPIAKMELGFTIRYFYDKWPPTLRYIIPNAAASGKDVYETTEYALHDLQINSYIYIQGTVMATTGSHAHWDGQGRLLPKASEYYDAVNELPEGLAQEKRNLVDTKVSQAYPEAVGHLKNAHDALWVKQPGDNWSVVGHNCWDALDAFAKAIYRPEYAPREREQPTDDQFKNKLTFTVSANTNEEELQQLLIALTNKTVDYAYRARRHDKQTTQAEAKRCVLYTYLLISEIYELLNPLV